MTWREIGPGQNLAPLIQQHLEFHRNLSVRTGGYKIIDSGLKDLLDSTELGISLQLGIGRGEIVDFIQLRLDALRQTQAPVIGCSLGAGTGRDSRDAVGMFEGIDSWTSVALADVRNDEEVKTDQDLGINYETEEVMTWLSSRPANEMSFIVLHNILHCMSDPLSLLELAYEKTAPGGTVLFNWKDMNVNFEFGQRDYGPVNWEILESEINRVSKTPVLHSWVWGGGPNMFDFINGILVIPNGRKPKFKPTELVDTRFGLETAVMGEVELGEELIAKYRVLS